MIKISKKTAVIVGIIALVILAGLMYFLFGTSTPASLSSVGVKNGDITEKINLTGQVKASQGVDLAFESQGRIVANYVKVGDRIYAGQPLLAIDDSILQSQLKQAQAQLDALNIDTVKSKTDINLQSLYANSLSAAQKSVITAKSILLAISDIQYNHFVAQTQENAVLQNAKAKAVYSLLGQSNAELWTSQNINQLNGGAFGQVQNTISNPSQNNIDSALSATQTALQDVSNLVNAVPIDSSLTATERASINSSQASINLEIITTSANIQAVLALKVNNSATITTTGAQIEAAQASIDAIKTQISKTVISALFNGQVDKDNAIVGQIVSPNVPVITISNDKLEIDTYIPEIDLASAKVGSKADVTLDAFGNNEIFPATIFSVDSAPTIVNGISAYGAKLKFNSQDDRAKPGMTANIMIISETHLNILMVPKSAVIQNNGKYFVVVDTGKAQKETREIKVGLHDDQNIEIISGLKLGEKVFAY